MDTGLRRPKTMEKRSLGVPSPERPSGSGLGHFSALIPSQDRPLRPKTDRLGPKTSQDRQHRFQERPRIANVGSKSGPRPPTEGPRATQDRQHRPQERLKTAPQAPDRAPAREISTFSKWSCSSTFFMPKTAQERQQRLQEPPRPPTSAPRATQDRQHEAQDREHRPQERPKTANMRPETANIGPKSGPRPPT